MAHEYTNLPVFSKVKIGETTYYLKDAELRALVDNFGDAVNYSVDTTFNPSAENLITSKAVASYLEEKVAGLTGAMHFGGVKESLPTAEEGKAGDVIIVGTAEYVHDGEDWILIGDEGVYATVQGVDAAYVKKTLTIAGIDLTDAITAEELKTALGLGSLAYKNSATGTIEGVVTGIADAEYTPNGTVEVVLGQTSTAMEASGSFTPNGSVTGKVTAAGTVSIAKSEDGTQISGTVSAPNITVTPTTAKVQHLSSVGSLPSYTAAQYVAPSVAEQKKSVAAEGMIASVGDNETLVITAASKVDALTATGFNAGSYEAAKFNAGALPTLGETQTVVTGISKAEASAPVFTGDKFGAAFAGQQVAIAADFEGQEGTINVSGNYDKANVQSATFSGVQATISHEVTTENKGITVQ